MSAFEEDNDFSQSEDIVIILENSEKFQLNDIDPSRYSIFQELINNFVKERTEIDFRDRYSIVVFGKSGSKELEDFKTLSFTLLDDINTLFQKTSSFKKNIDLNNWSSRFIKSLQISIQKCISVFKKVRNKTLRIIYISNIIPSLPESIRSKIEAIIRKTAHRLEIIMDMLIISGKEPVKIFEYENIFKQIADLTGGSYFLIKNKRQFQEAFESITKKKKVLLQSYLGNEEYKESKKFLEVIASDLDRITQLLSDADLKCQICFKKKCDCDDLLDVYDHLRKCPSCGKVLHLCCAGRWAEQQNAKSDSIGFPNVFRCPFCYYLLKVPRKYVNFDRIMSQLQDKWMKKQQKEQLKQKERQQKDSAIQDYISHVKEKQSDKEKIIDWLKEKLPEKSERKINEMAADIVELKTHEEKVSFLNYLKFKENIDDDSLPI